jgi:arsenate reductase-like glutaredoxin family protein
LEARSVDIKETVLASKKLNADHCPEVTDKATRLVAMKGKKVESFDLKSGLSNAAIAAMLGPTGNLRAPTLKVGKTVLVGFNESIFEETFG